MCRNRHTEKEKDKERMKEEKKEIRLYNFFSVENISYDFFFIHCSTLNVERSHHIWPNHKYTQILRSRKRLQEWTNLNTTKNRNWVMCLVECVCVCAFFCCSFLSQSSHSRSVVLFFIVVFAVVVDISSALFLHYLAWPFLPMSFISLLEAMNFNWKHGCTFSVWENEWSPV